MADVGNGDNQPVPFSRRFSKNSVIEVTGVGTVMTPTWTSDTNVNIEGGNIWPSATSAWGTIGAEALEQITETSVR